MSRMSGLPPRGYPSSKQLARVASEQEGAITWGQLARLGATEQWIYAALQAGELLELDGVSVYLHPAYRVSYDDFDRAAWFYVDPGLFAEERLAPDRTPREILSGSRALAIQGHASSGGPIIFACQERAENHNPGYCFVERPLQSNEWEWSRGIPIALPAFAIADMILVGEDEDSTRTALIDVISQNDFPARRFIELIAPAAEGWGHAPDDGAALFERFLRVDVVSHRATGGIITIQMRRDFVVTIAETPLGTEQAGSQ